MNEAVAPGQRSGGGAGGGGGKISFGSDQHIPKKIMTFFETPGKRVNPKSSTVDPKPSTLHRKPQTLNT